MKFLRFTFAISFLLNGMLGIAQQNMIVYFKDKPTSSLVVFSEEASSRREINESVIDFYDLQLEASYVIQLQQVGSILNTSRWLNAVTFQTELSTSELRARFPFIDSIKLVGKSSHSVIKKELPAEKSINYGNALAQTQQIGLDCLHEQGFTGKGIKLAIIDAGFNRMDSIGFFDSLYFQNRVFDTHDFVNGTSVYDYSGHGTAVSSCIVAQKFGSEEYSGTGKDVSLALYVAEDVSSETEFEEFNVVAALERADSAGARVVNISLGYVNFDDTVSSHPFSDMNGITTIAAIGVNIAFSKGLIVVMSAGNSGPDHISTPCDALHGFCVGAIDEFGAVASFSSVGPSFDLRVKPDIVARGLQPWLIQSNGSLSQASGTSFSSPIMAGAMACLVQAHPFHSASDVMKAVRMSASQFSSPDAYLGYGIPNMCAASDILASFPIFETNILSEITVFPNPASDYVVLEGLDPATVDVNLFDIGGREVKLNSSYINEGKLQFNVNHLSNGMYVIQLQSQLDGSVLKKRLIIQH